MSVWESIARDFNWKPLFKSEGRAYPCGATQGWAKPASLAVDCSQWIDHGCVCHTDLERALIEWKRELVQKLLARVFEISREAGISVQMLDSNGRQQWFSETLPERLRPVVQELEGMRERLELLVLRIKLQRNLRDLPSKAEREQRLEPTERPAPLAGPPSWTREVYRPR